MHQFLHAVVCHGYACGTEGVGFNDVRTCLKVHPVDIFNDLWLGQVQQVIVALHRLLPMGKTIPAKSSLIQGMFLEQGTHSAIHQ